MNNQLTPDKVKQYEERALQQGYFRRVLGALDQFANVVTGGQPDETISSRSQRAANRGSQLGRFMISWLSKIQPEHGKKAEAGDLARAERVEDEESESLGEPDAKQHQSCPCANR